MELGLLRSRIIFAAIVIIGFFCFLTNPIIGVPGTDSSIFYYVAKRMGDGAVPYRDVFDQKGPLMYFIDFLAAWDVWRCAERGCASFFAWALDMIAYVLGMGALWACLSELQRRCSEVIKIATLGLLTVFYHMLACGGNMPEMWIVIFSGCAYWLSLDPIQGKEVGLVRFLVMGMCVAAVMMLKLNMIAVAFPVFMSTRGDFRRIVAGAVGFGAGIALILAWYVCHGALGAVWEVYILYNAQYAAYGGLRLNTGRAFWPTLSVLLLNLWLWRSSADRFATRILGVNFVYILLVFAIVLISGGTFRYYGPVLPAIVVPIALALERIKKCKHEICILSLLFSFGVISILAYFRNVNNDVRESYTELQEQGKKILDKNSVTVLGCDCYAYFVLNAISPGRFPFQGTVALCSERYRAQIRKDIQKATSRYWVVPKRALADADHEYMLWSREDILKSYQINSFGRYYDIYERKFNR